MRIAIACAVLCVVLVGPACQRREKARSRPAAGEPGSSPDHRAQDRYRQPDRLVAALGLRAGDRVADVGAGGGYLTLRLARAVGPKGRVVATDVDGEALAALDRRAAAEGITWIETRRVPPGAPSLERAGYHLILLAQVDHLLPGRAAYLRALLLALDAGGRIAISNREDDREPLLSAARALPVSIEEAPVGLPAQLLVFLTPDASAVR